MKKIKTGIAGFGISAKVFHAPFLHLHPGYEITHFLERNKSESDRLYPYAQIVRSYDELLDADTDLIVITTPNDTHYEYATKALKAGKHVVVEKPFTLTSEEAKELVWLSKTSKGVLSVYHNRRYVSDFLTIKKILEENRLGKVHEYIGRFDRYRAEARPGAWREQPVPGSGILYDLGPHLIDQAIQLFGMPQSVYADIRRQRPHAVTDDYFELWLDYGHLKVTLHAGMLIREMGPRYLIHGDKGSFVKPGDDPQEALLRQGVMPDTPNWGAEPESSWGILHTENPNGIIREKIPSEKGNFGQYYNNLYETIINGAGLKEKPEDGYRTIKIIELAIQSYQKGQKMMVNE